MIKVKKVSRVLPVVQINGTGYYVDLGQRLFRDTMKPSRYIDFDSAEGRRLCRQAGVVRCLSCGASVIVSTEMIVYELRCTRCGGGLRG